MDYTKGNIERLTRSKAEELVEALSSSDHRFTVIEVVEKDGERFVRTAWYSSKRDKPFVNDQNARVLAVASLKRYLAKDLLGQVESYECEYDYFNNTFIETSSYSSEVSTHQDKVNVLKKQLEDVKALANILHIEDVHVDGLIKVKNLTKRRATFNEAVDCLIQVLSCDQS